MTVLTPVPSSCSKQMLGSKTNAVEFNGQAIRREGLEPKYFYLLRKRYQLKIQFCFVLGFPPFDLKHLEQTWVVLVDPTTPRRTREVFKVFKAAPLNFFGIIPGNKGVEAHVPVLQEIEPLFYILWRS